MQQCLKYLAAAALMAANPPAVFAEEQPLIHDLGTRHRHVQPPDSPFPAAGCNDHRTLMFVVREADGDDPRSSKLLAERDCRPLVPGADYDRCGPGGWTYPSKGERQSYAAYCRVGVKDLPLYALDLQMPPVE